MLNCIARFWSWCAFTLMGALLLIPIGCSPRKLALGRQCPSPYSESANVAGERPADGRRTLPYGSTCAPCDDGDVPELGADGCPIYVTFESCGGDVCIGGVRFPMALPDAGEPEEDDAGEPEEDDAGEPEEDDAGELEDENGGS